MPEIPLSLMSGPTLTPLRTQSDSRGYFSKIFDDASFKHEETLPFSIAISKNELKGTLRGLHFQLSPFGEKKLITCLEGSIFDVIVDLRPDSSNFGNWACAELSSNNPHQLHIPAGFAHGCLALRDSTIVSYLIWGKYSPEHSRRLAHDDPFLDIRWPIPVIQMSPQDAAAASFAEIKKEL
jgi:dTDP-4-dehydrorhamnose 3,5-epimerase